MMVMMVINFYSTFTISMHEIEPKALKSCGSGAILCLIELLILRL